MKMNQNINLNCFNSNNSTVAIFSYSIINTIAKNIFSHKNIMTNILPECLTMELIMKPLLYNNLTIYNLKTKYMAFRGT